MMYLHQHLLVFRVLTVIRFPAQLLHLGHQASVAHNLQQAGLQRDAEPGGTQWRWQQQLTHELFVSERARELPHQC